MPDSEPPFDPRARADAIRVLKASRARQVRLEQRAGETPRVVKRFASPGPLARLLDGRRAAREFRILGRLHAAGLPVPAPFAHRRVDGGHEVTMEWIPAARNLAELIEQRGADAALPAGLGRALGEVLAGLHAAGLDHQDLHPGNALVGASGAVTAIDFHSAHLGGVLGPDVLRRDLVRLAAGLRERTTLGLRMRAFVAWLHSLPEPLRASLGPRARLGAEVEAAARAERLETAWKRRLRWTRASGVCRPFDAHGLRGFVCRTLDSDASDRLAARVHGAPPGEPGRVESIEDDELGALLLLRADETRLRASVFAAARLEEHAIAAARTLAWTPRWAVFRLPDRAADASSSERPDADSARALGALLGDLSDRGLALAPSGTHRTATGIALPPLAEPPGRGRSDALLAAGELDLRAWIRGETWLGETGAREAFEAAFANAQRAGSGAREHARTLARAALAES